MVLEGEKPINWLNISCRKLPIFFSHYRDASKPYKFQCMFDFHILVLGRNANQQTGQRAESITSIQSQHYIDWARLISSVRYLTALLYHSNFFFFFFKYVTSQIVLAQKAKWKLMFILFCCSINLIYMPQSEWLFFFGWDWTKICFLFNPKYNQNTSFCQTSRDCGEMQLQM